METNTFRPRDELHNTQREIDTGRSRWNCAEHVNGRQHEYSTQAHYALSLRFGAVLAALCFKLLGVPPWRRSRRCFRAPLETSCAQESHNPVRRTPPLTLTTEEERGRGRNTKKAPQKTNVYVQFVATKTAELQQSSFRVSSRIGSASHSSRTHWSFLLRLSLVLQPRFYKEVQQKRKGAEDATRRKRHRRRMCTT